MKLTGHPLKVSAVVLLLFCPSINGQTNTTGVQICPQLSCDVKNTKLDENTCFTLVGQGPITQISGQRCYDEDKAKPSDIPNVCPFDLSSGNYGWLDEGLQAQTALDKLGGEKEDKSQIKYRKVKEYCVSVSAYSQLLNPGRDCGSDHQCITQKCKEGQCYGLDENENCYQHSDCGAGFYCRLAINWPFRALCAGQKGAYEQCQSDFECKNEMYCWYASPSDRQKNTTKCLPVYSQDDGTIFGWGKVSTTTSAGVITLTDYQQNGKYCASGLAYQMSDYAAKCTSLKTVTYKGNVLDAPYNCTPTDTASKCQINFNVDDSDVTYTKLGNRAFVEVPCRCSLGGSKATQGFCASVIGSPFYADAVANLANVLSSSSCHTLDRNSMRAQKDQCGIGVASDNWRMAVDKMFNVTYWPYVQVSNAYNCISMFFSDSYYNLIRKQATLISAATMGLVVGIGAFVVSL